MFGHKREEERVKERVAW